MSLALVSYSPTLQISREGLSCGSEELGDGSRGFVKNCVTLEEDHESWGPHKL